MIGPCPASDAIGRLSERAAVIGSRAETMANEALRIQCFLPTFWLGEGAAVLSFV